MYARSFLHRLAAALIGCLLLPLSAPAQMSEPHEAHTLEPRGHIAALPTTQPNLERASQRIVKLTNQFRREQGRGELKVNSRLSRAAEEFAAYLARTDKFSHTADGKTPSQRVSEHGYQYCLVDENIAWELNSAGFTTQGLARALVDGWERSPGHRRNMLDDGVEEIGVGIARSKSTGRYYAVQDFGRPKSDALTFSIRNDSDAVISYKVDGKEFSLNPNFTVRHERCRPPKLEFRAADGKSETIPERERKYQPHRSAEFIIHGGSGEGYRVEQTNGD